MNEKDFIKKWIDQLKVEGLKKFPADFISISVSKEIEVPKQTLLIGEEFFGAFEVITISGEQVYQANNYFEAKFIVYASRARSGNIFIPTDSKDIQYSVKDYEQYLDKILQRIENDFNKTFPKSKNFSSVSSEIFNTLNLVRY